MNFSTFPLNFKIGREPLTLAVQGSSKFSFRECRLISGAISNKQITQFFFLKINFQSQYAASGLGYNSTAGKVVIRRFSPCSKLAFMTASGLAEEPSKR